VINAGKPKYMIGAYVLICVLRELGCRLPIEVWYLGEAERNRAWEELVALDVDNVPVRDPSFLFNTPQYAQCDAII